MVLAAYFVLDEEIIIFIGHPNLEAPELYRVALSRERLKNWAFRIENTDADDLGMWDLDEWQCELGPLVEPLEKWITEGDLVWFVPHAELHLLPLHALKVGGCYLGERNPVAYSPSASIMSYCKVKGTEGGTQALVFGDSLQPPRNLVHAREEAKAVAEIFSTEPLLGNGATKDELKDELRRIGNDLRVLHVACHGDFDHADPLRSRIKLAPPMDGKSDDEDPDLSAMEVLGIEVKADLVALSACASGVSGRQGGDELIGLTRSFLYAGAPSVVVGLWYVADRSTRLLMGRFYDTLVGAGDIAGQVNTGKILTKAEALRQAQQYVLGTEQYEHPYFWAPFVLVGDWH